ncbi:nucleoside hydrolase [Rhodopirellula bahusiensis]|uniref:Nucleoside hydrolase n=1 Tax=Rhodopirellula bahusiensis TaxID=2014065 RepID=A0A2G1WD85_9BACT|nr:nucleoside hydrolase [Rhodopirellula bahusiensis]PHQ36770.1 nucleoside hydrolase [Rhodopirellula bahusiensis]
MFRLSLAVLAAALFDCSGLHAESEAAQSVKPTPVIFDTDITGDCDDVLALAMLHALQDRGECELKAVTISKVNPLAAPFVDAVNTFYGRGEIPIGATRDAQHRPSLYLKLCKTLDGESLRYPHDLLSSDDAPDAVEVLRRTLSESEDASVVIIQVGLAANLADLLESKADAISPLDGPTLLRKKCKLISVMAGCFGPTLGKPRHDEANVVNGIDAMRRFAELSPEDVPVVWSDYRIGIAVAYPRESIARDFSYVQHHPVREAYLLHSGPNHDRPTWDLTSVLFAIRPDDQYFDLSEPGRVVVDEKGFTEFHADANGRDRLLEMGPEQAIRVIEVQRALSSQPPRHSSSQ